MQPSNNKRPALMQSSINQRHLVIDLLEAHFREDNEILCAMNRELITRLEETRDSLRRVRTINRLEAMNMHNLRDTITQQELRIADHEQSDGIHYAVIREYFINNPEARDRWDGHVSFHDENYESAVLEHDGLGIEYNGLNEVVTDTEDDEEDPILEQLIAVDEAELQDIADNWL